MSIKRIALFAALTMSVQMANAQYNDSGISAGFFDASEGSTIDFSRFHHWLCFLRTQSQTLKS